ncbi:hypothetical protein KUCAC02_035402, partial [Chaenocephalus aceratus]
RSGCQQRCFKAWVTITAASHPVPTASSPERESQLSSGAEQKVTCGRRVGTDQRAVGHTGRFLVGHHGNT